MKMIDLIHFKQYYYDLIYFKNILMRLYYTPYIWSGINPMISKSNIMLLVLFSMKELDNYVVELKKKDNIYN